MRKPDRYERMVEDLEFFTHQENAVCKSSDVLSMLHKEHAWMRRVIQEHKCSIAGLADDLHPEWAAGYQQATDEFLNLLAQRRK